MAMAATLQLFLAATALLFYISEARRAVRCEPSDITITQSMTGGVVEGKPEYAVVVRNTCACTQSKVMLRCYGLSSVESIDPRVIKPVDDERCIVGNGRALSRGTPIRFKYAWMTPQDFPLVSSHVHC